MTLQRVCQFIGMVMHVTIFRGLRPLFMAISTMALPTWQNPAADRQVFAAQIRTGIDGHSNDEHLAVFRSYVIRRGSELCFNYGVGSKWPPIYCPGILGTR